MKRIFFIILLLNSLFISAVLSAKTLSAKDDSDNPQLIAKRLGWVSLPMSENICCGYYEDPLASLGAMPAVPFDTTAITINADQTIFHQSGRSLLLGSVSVAQPGRLVNADRAYLNRDAETKKITSMDLYGHVMLREPGRYVVGDSGHVDLRTKVAHLKKAIYRYLLADPSQAARATSKNADPQLLNAWGKADIAKQKRTGFFEFIHATYTTCSPLTNIWRLNAKKLDLNHDTGRGYAYNAWLNVHDVPVFYTPYFNFPIDKRRQSGFLFPYFGSSTNSGFNMAFPYYWNIAPNYDATITPQIFFRRGLLTSGLFRYLTYSSSGSLNASFLPNDGVFEQFKSLAATKYIQPDGTPDPGLGRLLNSSDNRYAFSWQDSTTFDPHWSGNVNYNSVSDDYYQQDFVGTSTLVPNILPREGGVNYAGDVWTFNGILQTYQTLHPVNMPGVSNPYDMLPQLNLNANLPDEDWGLQYQLNNQFTYFRRSQNPGETTLVPTAARANIQPGVSLPITSESGYITPNLQLAMTHYNIGSQIPGFAKVIERNVPIFDIDSGLYFDRDILFGKTDYQQTLEPRLFFLYVPYRNQDSIPLFDTGAIPFNYDALFLTNRFSGMDRIGDADQVAFALTTRFLNAESSAEKFRAGVGEIYYFRNRRVEACQPGTSTTTPSACVDQLTQFGVTPATEKTSPIAGEANYNINPAWNTSANVAWDPHSHQTVYASGNVQFSPKQNHILNFGYNFVRLGDPLTFPPPAPVIPPASHQNDLNQGMVSFAWPVYHAWSAVGQYGYNFSHRYPQSYFYGVEYDTCCWATRLVAGRGVSGFNQNGNPTFSSTIYLQFMFKGLATVGSADPTSTLINNIPGYRDTFQPFYGLTT